MDNAGTCCHPLHIPVREDTAIAQRICVLDLTFQDIGDGFNAAMGMPGKALCIFLRVIIAKIIHHQKRIKIRRLAKAENTVQMHPRPFHCWSGFICEFDRTDRHFYSLI